MKKTGVSITTAEAASGVAAMYIRGEVIAESEDALTEAYGKATGGGASTVILNFEGLEYMNSTGIGLLVTLLVRAHRQRHRLLAVGLTEHYRNIFQLTRLDEAIPVFATEKEALAQSNARPS